MQTNKWKDFILKSRFFHPVFLLFLTLFSAGGLLLAFGPIFFPPLLCYVAYALSAVTLVALCLFFAFRFGDFRRACRQRLLAHTLSRRWLTDRDFRTRIRLSASLSFNIAYGIFKLTVGLLWHAVWWCGTAFYYVLLAFLRFFLLRGIRAGEDAAAAWRRCRFCGGLLLFLTIPLGLLLFRMIYYGEGTTYPGMLIFAMAAYTFYSVTISILDAIRYRKSQDPHLFAARVVRLSVALVALLSLETAMLSAFADPTFPTLPFIAGTGICVLVSIAALSLYMIKRANKPAERKSSHVR